MRNGGCPGAARRFAALDHQDKVAGVSGTPSASEYTACGVMPAWRSASSQPSSRSFATIAADTAPDASFGPTANSSSSTSCANVSSSENGQNLPHPRLARSRQLRLRRDDVGGRHDQHDSCHQQQRAPVVGPRSNGLKSRPGGVQRSPGRGVVVSQLDEEVSVITRPLSCGTARV